MEFPIYVNDLEYDISSKVLKFADNTRVLKKVKHDTENKVYRMILINWLNGLKNGKCF